MPGRPQAAAPRVLALRARAHRRKGRADRPGAPRAGHRPAPLPGRRATGRRWSPGSALKTDLGLTRAEVEADLSLINLVNFGGGTYALTAEATDRGRRGGPRRHGRHVRPARPALVRSWPGRSCLALDLLGDAFALEGLESLGSVREKVGALVGEGPQRGGHHRRRRAAARPRDRRGAQSRHPRPADRRHRVLHRLPGGTERTPGGAVSALPLAGRLVPGSLLPQGRAASGPSSWSASAAPAPPATTFVPRPEIDLVPRRQGQAFSPDSRATWATVRFAPRWRTYLEDRGTGWEPGPDGSLVARIPYLDERWMAHEIIRFWGTRCSSGRLRPGGGSETRPALAAMARVFEEHGVRFRLRWMANAIAFYLALYLVDSRGRRPIPGGGRMGRGDHWPCSWASSTVWSARCTGCEASPWSRSSSAVLTVLVNTLILQVFIWIGAPLVRPELRLGAGRGRLHLAARRRRSTG